MKKICPLIMTAVFAGVTLFQPMVARADMFGGDVAVLVQILQNALQELMVLRQTLDVAKGDSDLLSRVNRDIDTALSEIHAIEDVVRDTNSVGKTKDPVELLARLRGIYGTIPKFGNIKSFEFADNASGNGLAVDNDTYQHAGQLDTVAIRMQDQARSASPGRSQQLTAQSQAVIIHSLAQMERTNATLLRVTSAELAIKNNEQKNQAESFDQGYSAMTSSKASVVPNLNLGSL